MAFVITRLRCPLSGSQYWLRVSGDFAEAVSEIRQATTYPDAASAEHEEAAFRGFAKKNWVVVPKV